MLSLKTYKGIFTSLTEYKPNKTVIKFVMPILIPMSNLEKASGIVEIFMPTSANP